MANNQSSGGPTPIEYGLIIALIGVIIITVVGVFGAEIGRFMADLGN